MVGSIDLIKATIEDAPLVAHLHIWGWRDGYQNLLPQTYLDSLDIAGRTLRWTKNISDESNVWIARYDGEPAAIISFGEPLNPLPQAVSGWCEITLHYTLEKFYRHGIGKILFNHARTSLASTGFTDMYVWVLEDNIKGCSFYNKMGGVVIPHTSKTATIENIDFKEIAYHWNI